MNELFKTNLKYQYNTIEVMVSELDNQFIINRFKTSKWSIHENLAHLGRYQEIFNDRVDTILNENEPHFERYNAEKDAKFIEWSKRDSFEIIKQTKKDRDLIVRKILRLNELQLTRIGFHPKLKKMKLKNWIEFFILHENHHLYTMFLLIHEFKAGE